MGHSTHKVREVLIRSGQIDPDASKKASEKKAADIERVRELSEQKNTPEQIASLMGIKVKRVKRLAGNQPFSLYYESPDARAGLPDNVDELIKRWYRKDKMSPSEIVEKIKRDYGVSRSSSWVSLRLQAMEATRTQTQANRLKAKKSDPCRKPLPRAKVAEAVRLYEGGQSVGSVLASTGLDCAYGTLRRALVREGCEIRGHQDAARVSTELVRPMVHLGDVKEAEMVTRYGRGDAIRTLAASYGVGHGTVRRVLDDYKVIRRTKKDVVRHRRKRYRIQDTADRYERVGELVAARLDEIRNMMFWLYQHKFWRYFSRYLSAEEVIDDAMAHVPDVASRWRDPEDESNFVTYVARYSLYRQVADYRSFNKADKDPFLSLDYEMSDDGFTLPDVLSSRPDPYATWGSTCGRLADDVQALIDVGELPTLAMHVLRDYYVPLAETGKPPQIKACAKKVGVSADVYSRMIRNDNFRLLIAGVLDAAA